MPFFVCKNRIDTIIWLQKQLIAISNTVYSDDKHISKRDEIKSLLDRYENMTDDEYEEIYNK